MSSESMEKRNAYRAYLSRLGIHDLRIYARHIGVSKPTKEKTKEVLLEAILDVLTGVTPPVPPSSRGAPVKEKNTDLTAIEAKIKDIDRRFSGESETETEPKYEIDYTIDLAEKFKEARGKKWILYSPEAEAEEARVYKGQVLLVDEEYFLIPLSLSDMESKMYIPKVLVEKHSIQEGDIVYCRAQRHLNTYQAVEICSVNETEAEFTRLPFAKHTAQPAQERMAFIGEKPSVMEKYLEWVLPIGKGQRGLIVAPPKTGKTTFLRELVKSAKTANPNLWVFVFLTEPAPETINAYKTDFSTREIVCTSFSDEVEKQVCSARLMLQRAKRYAEMGRDVLFILDSFNLLAQAYNETSESVGGKTLAGGLESKTLQFLREYFSAGRNIAEGGSFTFVGSVSVGTGNPADELICERISALANLKISLREDLAKKWLYPAIDFTASHNWDNSVTTEAMRNAGLTLAKRCENISQSESILQALQKIDTQKEFYSFLGLEF